MKSTESAGSGKHSFFRISGRYFEILTGLHIQNAGANIWTIKEKKRDDEILNEKQISLTNNCTAAKAKV